SPPFLFPLQMGGLWKLSTPTRAIGNPTDALKGERHRPDKYFTILSLNPGSTLFYYAAKRELKFK
uniref:Uncharacterized protein n=1 Tax=Fundulus heteroclitus TaxID=8078 RepID=A0A3Q2Q2D7_FUNHE